MINATGTPVPRKTKKPVQSSDAMTVERDCPGMSIGFRRDSENMGINQNAEKNTPAKNPQITAFVRLENGMACDVGLTTQAQRPGPRDASIATVTRWPGSLR